MAADGTTFRTLRDGDEKAVLSLVSGSDTAACTLEEWAWLFPVEEQGRAVIVGERDGEVAAVCAGAPTRVATGGREVSAVEILKLASAERHDLAGLLEHFHGTVGGDRFAMAVASLSKNAHEPPGFVAAPQPRLTALVRERPTPSSPGRLRYRAEPARDWEPRLDALWRSARGAYPEAVVRDADRSLRRFAGHPTIRHHRFLVFPRLSGRAVAFAVFAAVAGRCRWLDLVWDHDHPGALGLLAHISGRLVVQLGAAGEELWLAGDERAAAILAKRGFVRDRSATLPRVAAHAFVSDVDAARFVEQAYLTIADAVSPLG